MKMTGGKDRPELSVNVSSSHLRGSRLKRGASIFNRVRWEDLKRARKGRTRREEDFREDEKRKNKKVRGWSGRI